MKVGDAIAEILKREGVDTMFGYPVNRMFECAAAAKIKPITVRQERIGVHMADAVARVTSGKKIGVFAMQHGPGNRRMQCMTPRDPAGADDEHDQDQQCKGEDEAGSEEGEGLRPWHGIARADEAGRPQDDEGGGNEPLETMHRDRRLAEGRSAACSVVFRDRQNETAES